MWRVLVPFSIIAVLCAAAVWLADHPGVVTVTWQGYEIRTSFVMGLLVISLSTILGVLGYRLFATFMKSPAGFTSFLATRKRKKGYDALSKGMVAIAAGDSQEADHYAGQAHKLLDEPAMTLLLAAQAAQMKGDSAGATRFFEEMRGHSETEFLGLRGLYVQAGRVGNKVAERAYAEKAFALRPQTPWAAEAAFTAQAAAGDFELAAATLDKMLQVKLLTRDVARRRRAVLLAADAMNLADHKMSDKALQLASEAVEMEPTFAPPVALAARLMGEVGQVRKAGRLIERAWATHPHPDLADVYLTLVADEKPFDRLRRVKGLAARNPQAGESQMVLARAALAARDFETARDALEPLLVGDPTQRVCELMGALEGAEDHAAAAQVWLTRAIHAPLDACWVGDGYQSHIWVPVVPETGAFDALNWQVPASRDGERAALIPPAPAASEPHAEEERQHIVPAQDSSEEETPAETAEKDPAVDSAEPRDTLPEHIVPEHLVVAPDDPGPDGSGLEENGAKGEAAKW
ncbi:heme biosynthesis protein HemY [Parvibaculaceae bacterium PLY_AMNH_Bact1]|nr:heme biosynthesis protein HemY [Parvibaculaceae bacterium PLY_AMNH_Bact1]